MRRGLLVALTWLMAGQSVASPPAHPQHIMSLMLCTDALLLTLVPPERISSVTFLSRDRSNSLLWEKARKVGINHGLAEEVLTQHPDLVLAGTFTTPATRAMLKQLHLPLLEVPPAEDFGAIREVTRQVARAVGEEARGEQLLAQMDATLADLAATAPRRPIRVLSWDGGGIVPGKGTLFDAILQAAGGINIAALPGSGTSFGIERLLLARPDVLAFGDSTLSTPSLRTQSADHPLIRRLYAHRRVAYPELLYSCGIPASAQAARELRTRLLEVMAAGPHP